MTAFPAIRNILDQWVDRDTPSDALGEAWAELQEADGYKRMWREATNELAGYKAVGAAEPSDAEIDAASSPASPSLDIAEAAADAVLDASFEWDIPSAGEVAVFVRSRLRSFLEGQGDEG